MHTTLEIFFWILILLIFHTYLFFPLFLVSYYRKNNKIYSSKSTDDPISIVMAAYNEERVIKNKLESIFETDYSQQNIELLIGSDNSIDATNLIINTFIEEHPDLNIKFTKFGSRTGKINIVNQLVPQTTGKYLIITDANVMFDKQTLTELIKPFENQEIGLVDTHMMNTGIRKEGISYQESTYISMEVKIKNAESQLWGTMMGPFGGCFAIRKELFQPIPSTYLVDDFYINMKIFEQDYKAINNMNARVYEDVSNDLAVEFRRKIRISTGNFQNLSHFCFLLNPFHKKMRKLKTLHSFWLSFCFVSHKALRWNVPFFIVISYLIISLLVSEKFYFVLHLLYSATFLIPLVDLLLRKIGVHITLVRFLTHFYSMNLALMLGFFKYIKGVKSNVWQPTQRHQ